ncbi:MAG: hypothetical protein ACREUG_17055 [Steroidobacteraceae bacterium]
MNLAKAALHILGSVAPTLATAVAGPFGGMAVNAIESALGFSDQQSPADKQKAIETALLGTDPQTLLALKKAENDFAAQMAQLGIEKDKLTYDDVANARAMQMGTKSATPGELAWLVISGFLLMSLVEIVAMIGWPSRWALIPGDAMALMGMVFGYLANEAKAATSFYFGSSADSQSKTQTLSEIAKS